MGKRAIIVTFFLIVFLAVSVQPLDLFSDDSNRGNLNPPSFDVNSLPFADDYDLKNADNEDIIKILQTIVKEKGNVESVDEIEGDVKVSRGDIQAREDRIEKIKARNLEETLVAEEGKGDDGNKGISKKRAEIGNKGKKENVEQNVVHHPESEELIELAVKPTSTSKTLTDVSEEVTAAGTIRYCSSCAECTADIGVSSSGDSVVLLQSIWENAGSCVDFGIENGVTFDCQGYTIDGSYSGTGVSIIGSYNIVKDCVIRNFGTGVYLYTLFSNNIIQDSNLVYNDYGLYLAYANNNDFLRNLIARNYIRNVHSSSSSGNEYIDNTIERSNEDGIYMIYSDYNNFTGNRIQINTKQGVYMVYSDYNRFDNNIIYYNGRQGTDYHGVELADSTQNTFINNDIRDNGQNGVYLATGSSSNTFNGNSFTLNRYNGLSMIGTLNNVNNNYACDNDGAGSYYGIWSGGGNSGNNNTCPWTPNWQDNGQANGCDWQCSGCRQPENDLYVYDDMVLCSGTYNIEDTVADGVIRIAGYNLVLDCNNAKINGTDTGQGIHNTFYDDVEIRNCQIENYDYGIYQGDGYSYNTFYKNNQLEGNDNAGIYANSTQTSNFTNNRIENSWIGIELHESTQNNIFNNFINITAAGLYLLNSDNNNLKLNGLYGSWFGAYLTEDSDNNLLNDNTAIGNGNDIYLETDSNNNTGCNYAPIIVDSDANRVYTTPFDNIYLSLDTKLCPGSYNIEDTAEIGVMIINSGNINLDCQNASITGTSTGAGWGINNPGFDYVTIQNCNINNYFIGIALGTDSNYNIISRNNASGNAGGIRFWYSDNGSAFDNIANNNEQHGIISSYSNNNQFNNNIARNNGIDGITLYNSNDHIVYRNEMCTNGNNDINLNTANNITGFENTCDKPDGYNDDGTTGCLFLCAESGACYDRTIGKYIKPPTEGNWNISNDIECNDTEITLNGNLNVLGGFWINNVTLRMNNTYDGQYGISVYQYSQMHINENNGNPSIITNGDNASVYYSFKVMQNSIFSMRNSELEHMGWAWNLPDYSWGGLWINTDNAIIENNVIHDNPFVGLWLYESSNHSIINNTIRNNGWAEETFQGIRGKNSGYNLIQGNTIHNNADDGIYLSGGSENIILLNEIYSNEHGIALSNSPISQISENRAYSNSWDGISLSGSSDSVIDDNNVYSNSHDGIVIGSSPLVSFARNNATGNGDDGIEISGTANIISQDNTANGNGDDGIVVSSSPNSQLRNNLANNNNDGIVIGSSSNLIILNANASSNRDTGIYVADSNNVEITDTKANYNGYGILASQGQGIHFFQSNNGLIQNSEANYNTMYGIHLANSDYTNVKQDAVENNQGEADATGIYLSYSEFVNITQNEINNNKRGITIWKSVGQNRIENNNIRNNVDFGISLEESPDSFVLVNYVENNGGTGISCSKSTNTKILNNFANSNANGISIYLCGNSEINENEAKGNSGSGIACSSSNNVFVLDNNAKNGNNAGVYFTSCNNGKINNNNVSSNGAGITLSGSSNNQINQNLANNNYYGVVLAWASSQNNVSFNEINYNNWGLSIRQSSNYNKVWLNSIIEAVSYGGYIYDSDYNDILDNNFAGSDSIGIYMEQSDNNEFLRNDVRNSLNYGIDVYESDYNTLDRNDVRYAGDLGIELSNSHSNNLTNNNATQSAKGYSLRWANNNSLINNDGEYNGYGISLFDSDNNVVQENDADNSNNVGIELSRSDNNEILGNDASNAPHYGINLYSSTLNDISGNSVNNNGLGIYLEWSSLNNINNNVVNANNISGISLFFSSNNNNVSLNNLDGNLNTNIRVSSSDENIIADNQAEHSAIGLFLDWAANNDILRNYLSNNEYHGLTMEWFSNDNLVEENTMENNIIGAFLQYSSNNMIRNNTARNNNISINLEWTSNNNNIIQNTLENNGYHGIAVYWDSDYNKIKENVISLNNASGSGAGIYSHYSDNTQVENNEINSNNYGVYLSFSSANVTTNEICYNSVSDFFLYNSGSNSGDENTCDNPQDWSDAGATGCTYACFHSSTSLTLALNQSWNLISIPLVLENNSIENVFADIMNKVIVINGFEDGALTYDPLLPEFSDLYNIDYLHGYWVKMNQSANLTINGTTPENKIINLTIGWNLINYLCDTTKNVTDVFGSIMNEVIVINGFENGALTYDPLLPEFSDLQELKPNYGYWIKMNESAVLDYNSVC